MIAILTVIFAYIICFAVYFAAKRYVDKYCKDNEPIVWIWLDDEPESGSKATVTDARDYLRLAFSGSTC